MSTHLIDMPKVSVIMSVHNDEKFLPKSIKSILKQKYDDFEFLIVNDGSSDGTEEIIKNFGEEKITLIKNEKNIGLTSSLNKAIKKTKGKYIARIDADDYSSSDRLYKQARYLDKRTEVGVVGSYFRLVDVHENIIREVTPPTHHEKICDIFVKSGCPIRHSSVMIRKSVLDDVGMYNEKFAQGQDNELWTRVAKKYKIANIPEFLCFVRKRKDSITAKRPRIYNQYLHFVNRELARRRLNYSKKYLFTNVSKSIFRYVKSLAKSFIKTPKIHG